MESPERTDNRRSQESRHVGEAGGWMGSLAEAPAAGSLSPTGTSGSCKMSAEGSCLDWIF